MLRVSSALLTGGYHMPWRSAGLVPEYVLAPPEVRAPTSMLVAETTEELEVREP